MSEREENREKREKYREKYKPKNGVRCLFVAESPPRNSDRFFYFENVKEKDWLYIALMKALYRQEIKKTGLTDSRLISDLRTKKKEYLQDFCKDGFYLIDTVDYEFEINTRNEKISKITKQKIPLLRKIQQIHPSNKEKFPVILISKNVFDIMNGFLRSSKI